MSDKTKFHVFAVHGGIVQADGEAALAEKLEAKSEAMLRREVAMGKYRTEETAQQAAAYAQMELDRRTAESMAELTMRTTRISVGVGAFATIAGAILGAWLAGGF